MPASPARGVGKRRRTVRLRREVFDQGTESKVFRHAGRERDRVVKFWDRRQVEDDYFFSYANRLTPVLEMAGTGRFGEIVERLKRQARAGERVRIPLELWRKITWILSVHTVDILKKARQAGVPVVPAKVVRTRGGQYGVEMPNLKKPGCELIDGNRLDEYARHARLENLAELRRAMERDARILKKLGLVEDAKHPPFNAWFVVVDTRTGRGRRLLADVSNLVFARYPHEAWKKPPPPRRRPAAP